MCRMRFDILPRMNDVQVRRFKMICAFDGTNYYGWQTQSGVCSVQETIELLLAKIVKATKVNIHSSGRTDHGVHARGMVFHTDLITRMTERSLQLALNARLPEDIRILSCHVCASDFHARFSVVAKEYRYSIWNTRILPPNKRLYHAHVVQPLDLALIEKALPYLIGTHDFKAFAANPNRIIGSTVRTIFDFSVRRRGSHVVFRVKGDGFLYKMVRSLSGFLIRVGSGIEKPETAGELLLPGNIRTARVPSAPPQGLTLWQVWYE